MYLYDAERVWTFSIISKPTRVYEYFIISTPVITTPTAANNIIIPNNNNNEIVIAVINGGVSANDRTTRFLRTSLAELKTCQKPPPPPTTLNSEHTGDVVPVKVVWRLIVILYNGQRCVIITAATCASFRPYTVT